MVVHQSAIHRVAFFLFGIIFAFALIFVGGYLYLHYGHPPVAVDDPAFPYEAQIVHVPLGARISREIKQAPFPASEDAFKRGAEVYKEDCAFCHGVPSSDSVYGTSMYPAAPQLWLKHKKGNVVGVSDDEVGETYWKVKNGIRLTGMPTYDELLSDSDIWDVSLLLKNADQQLPAPVMKILKGQ
ncbi:MAG TPA: cytochrome c [Acidobacteriaceae bacterium]|nr:cytochrome c [Acidobacteriaceae bacterium]